MRANYLLVLWLVCLKSAELFGQTKQFNLMFKPLFANKELCLDSCYYPIIGSDSIKITTLKFYISNIVFLQNGNEIFAEPNSYHLIDAKVFNSQRIPIIYPQGLQFDAVKFNIGIDSLTNVSGAMEADLDPSNGMYWTWQSGYINLMLEATCVICTAKKKEIVFHLGGYQNPFNALQTKVFPINIHEGLTVNIALENLFNQVNLNQTNHLMSPSQRAIDMSILWRDCFTAQIK